MISEEEGTNVRIRDYQQMGVSEGVFSINGKHKINVVWRDDTNLVIDCYDVQGSSIVTRQKKWGQIDISYNLK